MTDGNIYLIACAEPMAVKIGFTRGDPRARLKQLQVGCPAQLVLIGWAPGDMQDEREYHAKLAPFRISGEWFLLVPEANDALRGIVTIIQINNRLTSYDSGDD